MKTNISTTTWLYTVIINPGINEHLLGQTNLEKKCSFIPAFTNRKAAENGISLLSIGDNNKYEIQAIIYEDLMKYALDGKFFISIIDESWNI